MLFRSVNRRPFGAVRISLPLAFACCTMALSLTACERPSRKMTPQEKEEWLESYSELEGAIDDWRFDYAMSLGGMSTDEFFHSVYRQNSPSPIDYALLVTVGRYDTRERVRATILELAEDWPEQWLESYLRFAMGVDPTLFPEIAAMHPGFELCGITQLGMPLLVMVAGDEESSAILDLLLERGCDPNVLYDGVSAVAFAVLSLSDDKPNLDAARKLVRHGADLDLVGHWRRSARKILQDEGMYEELALLEREAAAAAARKGAGQ